MDFHPIRFGVGGSGSVASENSEKVMKTPTRAVVSGANKRYEPGRWPGNN
jgi:hypothetical protein